MHNVSFKIIDSINSKMTISLYLDDWYSKDDNWVIELIKKIKGVSPALKVEYKDKDKVLEEIKNQDEELVKILEKSNPLPNTIVIRDIPLSKYEELNYIIGSKLFLFWEDTSVNTKVSKSGIATYQSQYQRIIKVISILQTLGTWLYVIIFVFLVAISIIIYSIIWNFIYYYKDEIYITRLVWWSRVFIFWPFSMQWILYSIISFIISVVFFNIFIKNITYIFGETYDLEFLFNDAWIILGLELLLFIFIWALSWYFSSKKYLK